MGDDYVLRTEDLTKDFAGFVAVGGVGLRVRAGTIHALIGPNGAGKTTVFNLLTGFLPPTAGRIFFKGRDITTSKPAELARQGLVRSFQISAVFPHLTVLENVRVARFSDGEPGPGVVGAKMQLAVSGNGPEQHLGCIDMPRLTRQRR